jgi:molybdopterin/thiamine biosynthesis adenylyltransferase
MDRHARQARLAGVGAEGQARIGRASVDVRLDGFAADVAARYLAGAGVGCVRVRAEDLAEGARAIDAGVRVEVDPSLGIEADTVDLEDPGARDLARGALHALRAIRAAIEGSS